MRVAAKLIVLLAFSVTAVTLLSAYSSSKQYLAGKQKRHALVAELLESQMESDAFRAAVEAGEHERLQAMVGTVAIGSRVRWVWLQGTVDDRFRPEAPQILAARVEVGRVQIYEMWKVDPQRRSLYSYFPNLMDGRLGAIEVSSRLSDDDAESRQIWFNAILTISAMALLSIGMIMTAGVRWIARPLEQLTQKMKRVGEGDFASDLDIRSRDELGELGAAVNQMCERLRTQQAAIEAESRQKIEALEQLRHADRLKTIGQLAAGVAHEVGTPLNVVSGRASMILDDANLDPERVRANARAIKTESERISTMIQRLLAYARRDPSQKMAGNLQEVIRHAVDLLTPLAEKERVSLQVKVPPQAAAEFDFGQIQQVIMNLVDNAIEASPPGGKVEIELHRDDSGALWKLSVADEGKGIPEGQREILFEPFFTTKEAGEGTGLGLSISREIVEAHGGTLEVEGIEGEGARFVVTLPASDADHDRAR